MELILLHLERAVWGWPLIALILGSGVYLTVFLRFLPIRKLGAAMRLAVGSRNGSGVTPFGALCTTLSATIGTGNLIGVASAIAIGGPGALFWMEVSAVTGMAVKYAEGYLAILYRRTLPDGTHCGGPSTYILLGLGRKWKQLAVLFACFGAAAGLFGVGTFVQVGSISACLEAFLSACKSDILCVTVFGRPYSVALAALGIIMTVGTALLVFRGIGSLSRISSVLVPCMGGLYLVCCLWILANHLPVLPKVLHSIVSNAFAPTAVGGGVLGTIQAGVSRGVFSNEAGLGTAPIAAASADGAGPCEQGLISMTASVFDTLIICTMTGLVILCSGTNVGAGGIQGVMEAFASGLPLPQILSRGLVVLILLLFGFTTVVGWSFYGVRCLAFLTGGSQICERLYLSAYVGTVFIAPYFPVQSVWMAANICNSLMAVPNLIAILLLSSHLRLDANDIDAIMDSEHQERGCQNGNALSGRSRNRLHQASRRSLDR